MTRILRITLKYKFVKPLARRSEQQESAARPVCGARRALKLFSTLSEHFIGNESTQNRTKVHKMAPRTRYNHFRHHVRSLPVTTAVAKSVFYCSTKDYQPTTAVATNRASRMQSQIYLNFAEAMPIDGRAQVAPLQLCTIPVYKSCFSPISHISRLSQKIHFSPPSRTFPTEN